MSKVLGLILELNPFHNGHYYFIQEAKKQVNPDYTVAVLSTNFTMRGDISVLDKFQKTKLALKAGINLVMELPFLSAVNSADFFAFNSVKILTEMGITDLAFGTELDDYGKLEQMKTIIDSPLFQEVIRENLAKGFSYSAASLKALSQITEDPIIREQFPLPNNTLGIQYLRGLDQLAIHPKITVIKRIGNQYYDSEITGPLSSATSLRCRLQEKKPIDEFVPEFAKEAKYISQSDAYAKLYVFLRYLFSVHEPKEFQSILGVNEGIENRFASFIGAETYEDFVKTVQTKRYTANKIKRLILHILLNSSNHYENLHVNYLRILGADQKGLDLVSRLPKETKGKLVSSIKNRMSDEPILKEYQATKLYGLITGQHNLHLEEFKVPIIQGGNE